MEQKTALESKKYRGEKVRLCEDGKYRWTYSLNMYRNPSILFVVLKIFAVLFGIGLATLIVPMLFRGEIDTLAEDLKIFAIVLAVFFAICLLAYLIVARMYGGRYVVDFTMDDKGLLHKQIPIQAKKARKMASATFLAGAAAGRPGTMGAGALATRTEMSSDFQRVRKVKAYPRRNLIKVNELLGHNQVYVTDEDFAFVLDFIRSRCPGLK